MTDNAGSIDPLVSSGTTNTPQYASHENGIKPQQELPRRKSSSHDDECSVEAMPGGSRAFKNFCSQLGISESNPHGWSLVNFSSS